MTGPPRLPGGVRLIVGFHMVSLLLWTFGQTFALVSYDTVAARGFQEPRSVVHPVIVEVNRAIALADTVIMLPLLLVAAVGLLRRRFYGAIASWLVFGITLYWPVVYWSSQMLYRRAAFPYPAARPSDAIPAVMWAIAAWGSWYLAHRRSLFT